MTEHPSGVFCWVDLTARDLDAAKRWYGELFGWTVEHVNTSYALFYEDGMLVAGAGRMSDAMRSAGARASWNDYVKVTDCAAIEAKALALGGKVSVPTTTMTDAGSLCFLQDPSGAGFALWQPDQHHGARRVGAPGSYCRSELATRDVEGAKHFYTALFGWDYASDPLPGFEHTIITAGGREIGGIIPMTSPAWDDEEPHWNTYFAVADVDATVASIIATGGRLFFGPGEIDGVGRFAVVCDPQWAKFVVIRLSHPRDVIAWTCNVTIGCGW